VGMSGIQGVRLKIRLIPSPVPFGCAQGRLFGQMLPTVELDSRPFGYAQGRLCAGMTDSRTAPVRTKREEGLGRFKLSGSKYLRGKRGVDILVVRVHNNQSDRLW
jgi:hypothetical protein